MGVIRVKYEQMLKKKFTGELKGSDVELKGSNLIKLIVFSFLGGWVSGALGLGGGSIFNPLLLSMGVPPKVASATGMYMIIFSTGASTFIYLYSGKIDIGYGCWVGGFNIVGTILGMQGLEHVMKKFDR